MLNHLFRYAALAFTYVVGRGILFLALLLPSLAGANSADLGYLELVLVAGSLGASLGPLGTNDALMHLDFASRRRTWRLGVMIALGGGLFFSALVALPASKNMVPAAALLGASLALNRISQGHLRVQGDLRPLLLSAVLLLITYVAFFSFQIRISVPAAHASLYSLVAASLLSLLPSWLVQKHQDSGEQIKLMALLSFGLPLTIAGLSAWIVAASDRYMLKWIVGIDSVGIYGLVVRTVMLYSGACATLVLWWQVETLRHGNEWTLKHAKNFLPLTSFLVAVTALLLWYPLLHWIPSILPSIPDGLVPLVSWRLFAVVFWVLESLCLTPFIVARKVRVVAAIWAVNAILNVLLNLILIHAWGMPGAAAATFFSNLIAAAFAVAMLRRYLISPTI